MSCRRAVPRLLCACCLSFGVLVPGVLAGECDEGPLPKKPHLRIPGARVPVTALAFSPDGKLLALGGRQGTVVIRDAVTGRERNRLSADTATAVQHVRFVDGAKKVAALCSDGSLHLWSVDTGRVLGCTKDDFLSYALAASPDGTRLALAPSSETDNPVVLWRSDKPSELTKLGLHRNVVAGMAFSRDGKKLLTADRLGHYTVWDVPGRKSLRRGTLDEGWYKLAACGFTPDGGPLVALGPGSPARLFDGTAGRTFSVRLRNEPTVRTIALSADGRWLALAGSAAPAEAPAGYLSLWDVARRREVIALTTGGSEILALAFSADGKSVAAGDRRGTTYVWGFPAAPPIHALHTLRGHTGSVNALACTPDGRRLASAGADGKVCLWDPDSGRGLATLTGHTSDVRALAFAPDGKTLASGGCDRTVRLWDAVTGKLRSTFTEDGVVLGLAFTPDGTLLAAGLSGGQVRLRDVRTGKASPYLAGHNGPVHSGAFSPDGKLLASGSSDHVVMLWDVAKRQDLADLDTKGSVRGVAFSRDGKALVAVGGNGTLSVWDVKTSKRLSLRTGAGKLIWGMALAPDPGLLATVSLGGEVRLWDVLAEGTTREHSTWTVAGSLRCVTFLPRGKGLVTAGGGGTLTVWHLAPRPRPGVPGAPAGGTAFPWQCFHVKADTLRSLAVSPDGKTLAAGCADGRVVLWDLNTGKVRRTLRPDGGAGARAGRPRGMPRGFPREPGLGPDDEAGAADNLQFTKDGRTLVVLHDEGVLRLWDVRTGKKLWTTEEYFQPGALALSPDGKSLALPARNWDVLVWVLATNKVAQRLQGRGLHDLGITGVAFAADGKRLLSVDKAGAYGVWDLKRGKASSSHVGSDTGTVTACAFGSPRGHALVARSFAGLTTIRYATSETTQTVRLLEGVRVTTMAFSPDGRVLAVGGARRRRGGDAGVVQLWDVSKDRVTFKLSTTGAVVRLAFTPDGRTLVTADATGAIQLWETPSGYGPRVLEGHTAVVYALAYTRDGRTLASGAGDGTVKLWGLGAGIAPVTLGGPGDAVRAVAFAPDGKTLAAGSGRDVRLWDIATRKARRTRTGLGGVVASTAFSPDGKTLAVGVSGGSVHVWDIAAGKDRQILTGHKGPVYAVAFSPDGKTLATGAADGRVRRWDTACWKEGPALTLRDTVRGVAFGPGGKMLGAVGARGTVRVWDVKTGKQLAVGEKLMPSVWPVGFAPDGKSVALASVEGGVTWWDLTAGAAPRLRKLWDEEPSVVRCLAISPDGKVVATGGTDHAVKLWKWPAAK